MTGLLHDIALSILAAWLFVGCALAALAGIVSVWRKEEKASMEGDWPTLPACMAHAPVSGKVVVYTAGRGLLGNTHALRVSKPPLTTISKQVCCIGLAAKADEGAKPANNSTTMMARQKP